MRTGFVSMLLAVCSVALAQTQTGKPDPWTPIRFLIGQWRGTSSGQPGNGTVARQYEFVLGGRFIHERNISAYVPKEKDKPGEVHEHWSFLSYDKQRKVIVLRQFHQEGFVNRFSLNAAASSPIKLVFESEQFENFDNSWRARETYEVVSDSEFVEIFELAPPSRPFEVYSRNQFKRVR